MSDVEGHVGAILEKMVNATVTEITKVIGVPDSPRPEASSCTTGHTQVPSPETVC